MSFFPADNHFGSQSINLLECGSWYYCFVVTGLIIIAILCSIILSRIPYNSPPIKILNYHSPGSYSDNLNKKEIDDYSTFGFKLISNGQAEEMIYTPRLKSDSSVSYITKKSPVCIFKSSDSNKNINTALTKEEMCNLLISGKYNIHAPTLDTSFVLYKIASVCNINNPIDIKVKKNENDYTKLIHGILDKDNGFVIGLSDIEYLEKFDENGLINFFTVDGNSCVDNVDEYVFNCSLKISTE
jgi:hypothetical protein